MILIRSAISRPKRLFLLPRSKYASTKATQQPLTATSTSSWPKPSIIQYQPKVSNFVNLFGRIEIPIEFQSTPDGKNMAATSIAQLDGPFIANSFIPVLFEGDLAHTVASHVKQNDCVHVSGKLSLTPLLFAFTQFHLIGNDINFVQGLDMQLSINDVVKEQVGPIPIQENVVEEQVGKRLDLDSSTPLWAYNKLDRKKSGSIVGGIRKGGNSSFNSWRDLVKSPMDWCDYREKKSIGSVNPKHPDFKHKTNGTALWLNTAPTWVLAGLAGLNLGGTGKIEDSWKDLVENPDNWWDNRFRKTKLNAPDFKHKETGESLWLNSMPEWVLSHLPSSKNEHNVT